MTPDLARMVAARQVTAGHIASVEADCRRSAEAFARGLYRPESSPGGRGSTNWQRREEIAYLRRLARLVDLKAVELAALHRKLARQDAAIDDLVARRRLNEHPLRRSAA